MAGKRSSDDAQFEDSQKFKEPSTEDLEEAMYQVSKAAAAGREKLIEKAKKYFSARNGRVPSSEEMDSVFDTLRESMMDEEAGQSSSDEEDDNEGCEKLQDDIESAYEHVRDLGKEAGKKMQQYMKNIWSKENNGGEPSQDECDAVMYHLKHLAFGAVPVEDEGQTDDDEEYEPSELEKESAEEEAEHPAEKEECAFDFNENCEVSEEQFEKIVEKFCAEKGREPTEEETDTLISSFSQKLTEATFEEHDDDDYEKEKDEESEDEDENMEEDKSLEDDDMECEEEESDEQEYHIEEQSNAFKYMKEVEEGESDEEEEEEPSKQQQAEEQEQATEICA